jgi:predicted PurR-regulated permease PerM
MGHLFWVFTHAIIWSLILVSLFGALHQKIEQKLKGRSELAAALTLSIILVGVFLPGSYFIVLLSEEALLFYQRTSQNTDVVSSIMSFWDGNNFFAMRLKELAGLVGFEITSTKLSEIYAGLGQSIGLFLYERLSTLFSNIFNVIFQFGMVLIISFAFFVHGTALKKYLMDLSPLPDDEEEKLIERFQKTTQAIFMSNGFGSLLQGVFGGLGFYFFGVGPGILWGAVITILALLPVAGASIVFLPIAGYWLINGKATLALGYLVYNVFYVIVLEYWLKPKLIGNRASVDTTLVFVCVVAGMSLYGIMGLFYGPLIIAMFLTVTEIYHSSYRSHLVDNQQAKTP